MLTGFRRWWADPLERALGIGWALWLVAMVSWYIVFPGEWVDWWAGGAPPGARRVLEHPAALFSTGLGIIALFKSCILWPMLGYLITLAVFRLLTEHPLDSDDTFHNPPW
jgi:hypothetical protein